MAGAHKEDVQRKATDRALRDERARTDETLDEQASAVEAAREAGVVAERERVDARRRYARRRSDERIAHEPSAGARAALEDERREEDAATQAERAKLDSRLSEAQAKQHEVLLRLFGREREQTDRHLATERANSDEEMTLRLRYLAMLGHDLRSMVTTVQLQTALLEREPVLESLAEKVSARAERIRRVVRRMERLMTDLVDIASAEAGTLKVIPREADLAQAVAEITEEYQSQAESQGILLEGDVRDPPLVTVFDYERILQVLANLVGNALKYTPSGGRVSLRAERTSDALRLSVRDTGRGIPADKLDVIFERFVQLDASSRPGAGLGLYIARSIIAAHGGRLWVESRVGKGSTFVFTLPLRRVSARESTVPAG